LAVTDAAANTINAIEGACTDHPRLDVRTRIKLEGIGQQVSRFIRGTSNGGATAFRKICSNTAAHSVAASPWRRH
jgi:hypothetical protein